MEFFRKNPQAAESLRGPIFEDKVVDYILDQAQVEERTVTPEELAAEPGGRRAAAWPAPWKLAADSSIYSRVTIPHPGASPACH